MSQTTDPTKQNELETVTFNRCIKVKENMPRDPQNTLPEDQLSVSPYRDERNVFQFFSGR